MYVPLRRNWFTLSSWVVGEEEEGGRPKDLLILEQRMEEEANVCVVWTRRCFFSSLIREQEEMTGRHFFFFAAERKIAAIAMFPWLLSSSFSSSLKPSLVLCSLFFVCVCEFWIITNLPLWESLFSIPTTYNLLSILWSLFANFLGKWHLCFHSFEIFFFPIVD